MHAQKLSRFRELFLDYVIRNRNLTLTCFYSIKLGVKLYIGIERYPSTPWRGPVLLLRMNSYLKPMILYVVHFKWNCAERYTNRHTFILCALLCQQLSLNIILY